MTNPHQCLTRNKNHPDTSLDRLLLLLRRRISHTTGNTLLPESPHLNFGDHQEKRLKHIGTFQSKQWGTVNVMRANYGDPNGPLAIVLELETGELLTRLSVNMYKPECSHDSKDLPPDCFYVMAWEYESALIDEALASGLFTERLDMPNAHSGFVCVPVWQLAQ